MRACKLSDPSCRLTDVPQLAHTIEAIEALLRRGETPKTDNLDALLELGFARSIPLARDDYDASLWERSREHARRGSDGSRLLVRERAVFERPTPPKEPADETPECAEIEA
ncbi:MAG: hypothetical protein NVS1B2_17560 [Vulcanimicrobiaceae bacterium]